MKDRRQQNQSAVNLFQEIPPSISIIVKMIYNRLQNNINQLSFSKVTLPLVVYTYEILSNFFQINCIQPCCVNCWKHKNVQRVCSQTWPQPSLQPSHDAKRALCTCRRKGNWVIQKQELVDIWHAQFVWISWVEHVTHGCQGCDLFYMACCLFVEYF